MFIVLRRLFESVLPVLRLETRLWNLRHPDWNSSEVSWLSWVSVLQSGSFPFFQKILLFSGLFSTQAKSWPSTLFFSLALFLAPRSPVSSKPLSSSPPNRLPYHFAQSASGKSPRLSLSSQSTYDRSAYSPTLGAINELLSA